MATKTVNSKAAYEVLHEVPTEGAVWKAQKVTYADGTFGYGLRKFAILKSGQEQLTGNGIYLVNDDKFAANVAAIGSVLDAMVKAFFKDSRSGKTKTKIKTNTVEQKVEYVLRHTETRSAYGAVNWKGLRIKGIRKVYSSVSAAKAVREQECPEKYRKTFKVVKLSRITQEGK